MREEGKENHKARTLICRPCFMLFGKDTGKITYCPAVSLAQCHR